MDGNLLWKRKNYYKSSPPYSASFTISLSNTPLPSPLTLPPFYSASSRQQLLPHPSTFSGSPLPAPVTFHIYPGHSLSHFILFYSFQILKLFQQLPVYSFNIFMSHPLLIRAESFLFCKPYRCFKRPFINLFSSL